jgi:hypothetical protein
MSQSRTAAIIRAEAARWCQRAGLQRVTSLTVVLIANAWAESKLDPLATGDGGLSVGLFQLHTGRGLGRVALDAGYTWQQLQDPRVNTALILWEMDRFPAVRQQLDTGTLAGAVDRFTVLVERPKHAHLRSVERQQFAASLAGVPAYTRCAVLQ